MCFYQGCVAVVTLTLTALTQTLCCSSLAFANEVEQDLKWQCSVIQTRANSSTLQSPVVTGVDIQPGGNLVAVVGDDHVVGIYDKLQEKFVHHLNKHTDWVRSASFTPDGKKLVTAGNDGRIFVWSVNNWNNAIEIAHLSHAIVDLDIHPDGDQIAAVGFDNTLKVFSIQQRRIVQQIGCPCKDMRSITYSPSGMLLAGGGRNGKIEIWDATQGKSIQKISAHDQRIRSMRFMDDRTLISCGDDRKTKLFNIGTNESTELSFGNAKLFDVAILGNDMIATCGTDNLIHIWNVRDRSRIGFLHGHDGCVSCLDVDGTTLVSGSFDTKIRVWQTSQQTNLIPPNQPRFGASQWQQRNNSGQLQNIK